MPAAEMAEGLNKKIKKFTVIDMAVSCHISSESHHTVRMWNVREEMKKDNEGEKALTFIWADTRAIQSKKTSRNKN
jgi:hypothetical protein